MAYKPITKRANGMITPPKKTMNGPGGPNTPAKGAVGTNKPTYIYIVGEEGKQNRQVSKAQYDKWTGPKIAMSPDDPKLKTLGTGKSTGVKPGYIPKK
jgi:hypothetical protein